MHEIIAHPLKSLSEAVSEQSWRVAEPMEDSFAPNQNHHPSDNHHGDTIFKGVAPAVMVGGVQKRGRLAVEGQYINMFDKQGNRE